MLCGDDPVSRIVYHALAREFTVAAAVVEERVPRRQLVGRRLKSLGPVKVLGQLLFQGAVLPGIRRRSAERIAEIFRTHRLDDAPINGPVVPLKSVNSPEARTAVIRLAPDVVVVNGTRIIDADLLAATDAPFLNMHAGITPLYRGVHGGYWALAECRPELVGTTVHLVSKGIDTGRVVAQGIFSVTAADSFATYPYLHVACGLPLLLDAVRRASEGTLVATKNPRRLPSKLRTHPTAWGYLARRIVAGAR
jgi:folate-dependent phosphoribosylglycinamide formyltransferase PurN